ncbi:hypothetical protein ACIA8C_19320 [Nocardia sp. NPDC051321]|uniref:hypothetical protein n=1 Tax=Nocardia sp. NPDC051321 TaxID=3364323 RepID=UPI0037B2715F
MNAEDNAHDARSETGGAAGDPITVEMLRWLLDTDAPNACLVLEAGRVEVDSGAEDQARGLVLISRTELRDRIGTNPGATALSEQAALLNTEVRLQGA